MKNKHKVAYMECAKAFSRCSVGVRLKVGAVIVKGNNIISCGYNALPSHINGPLEDSHGVTRPEVRHAEKNALLQLTKNHESCEGATLFCTHACCYLCSVDIVDSGIKRFIYESDYRAEEGINNLIRNGVEVERFDSKTNTFLPVALSSEACDCARYACKAASGVCIEEEL